MSRSVVATIEVHCSQPHAFEVFTTKVDLWWPVGHRKFGNSEQSVLRFAREVGGRFPEPTTTGKVQSRNSSISSWARRVWTSCQLPCTWSKRPSWSLSRATSAAMSPVMGLAFFHSSLLNVDVATNLVALFIFLASGLSSPT